MPGSCTALHALWLLRRRALLHDLKSDLCKASLLVPRCAEAVLPGVLQPAQAVRWSHWLLGHAASWQRDDMRLRDMLPRVATLPLGSGVAPVLQSLLPPQLHWKLSLIAAGAACLLCLTVETAI